MLYTWNSSLDIGSGQDNGIQVMECSSTISPSSSIGALLDRDLFDFLNIEPILADYGRSDEGFRVTVNNPAAGFCGWTALAFALRGRYEAAVELRQEVLEWWQEVQAAPRRLHNFLDLLRARDGGIVTPETMDHVNSLEWSLSSGLDQQVGSHGRRADLHAEIKNTSQRSSTLDPDLSFISIWKPDISKPSSH
ncbi:hypothetical protein P389DRAFT_211303 [Cystobasidium minutum MCA 4210]|uniref:uncharacterized protein n=1 Tax=Cystobasidium minutum MCA 4210 TaxID=1397322 RepID=UPI0034CE0593|eukprot:jgi/Rhomi1/211303/estExt_Genemark1.C_4_t20466